MEKTYLREVMQLEIGAVRNAVSIRASPDKDRGRMKTKLKAALLLLLMSMVTTACYTWDDIPESSMGIGSDGGRLDQECKTPGVYSDWSGAYKKLREVPTGSLTFEVTDNAVLTLDNQVLKTVQIAIQIRRKKDCESIKDILTNWPSLATDDEELIRVTKTQVGQGLKQAINKVNLSQFLANRTGVGQGVKDDLVPFAAKFDVEVISVSINDFDLDDAYVAKLETKAQITVDIDIAKRNQDLAIAQQETARKVQEERNLTLIEQRKAEEAQTLVDVEIASREGKKIEAANSVYQTNEQAFELRRLELLKGLLSASDKIYFVPEGTDLTLFISGLQGTAVPVPQNSAPANPGS